MKKLLIPLLLLASCNIPSGTKLPDINADKAMSYVQKFSSADSVSSSVTDIVRDSATNFVKGKVSKYVAGTNVDQWLDTGKLNARVGLIDSLATIEQQVEGILNKLKR